MRLSTFVKLFVRFCRGNFIVFESNVMGKWKFMKDVVSERLAI